jgi:YidC/Oxa1 family membrane protein insertase
MEKKTVLAIILITLVLTVSMVIQGTMFQSNTTATQSATTEQTAQSTSAPSQETSAQAEVQQRRAIAASSTAKSLDKFTVETDLFEITFDPVGASVSSMKMKEHADADGDHVDLVFKGEKDHNAFLMYWGDDFSNPIMDAFSYSIQGKKVIFSNDYVGANGEKFTVIKTFEFKDGEYLFAVTVDIVGDSTFTGLSGDYAYTIAFEPQVGPAFTQMKNNAYDYRRVYIDAYNNKGKLKRSTVKLSSAGDFYTTSHLKWMALTGKYFTVIAYPEDNTLAYKYSTVRSATDTVVQTDSLYVSRPNTGTSTSDTIYFYAGPQLKKYLGSYYSGMDNAWKLSNTNLDAAMEGGSMFGWLENILKWALTLLYKIVPNYGVGIILLTIIIKILLWPLSKKSASSTAKMGALQPKLQEIQAKYKDNPQKLNQETAALYKEAGVSPLGGCLPMLLQFPILIAMYGLLNKHFELRGAMFIPGWIPDLSVPETIATLGFNLPLLGNEIHLLPILYTVSMIFSMKITQTQSNNAQGGGMMKFMTYGMPILFFFILYSAPSGLLLYWSAQNALSMIQQVYTNAKLKKNPNSLDKPKAETQEKVPEAVRKYQEKLKRLEEEKARLAKEQAKGKKKK